MDKNQESRERDTWIPEEPPEPGRMLEADRIPAAFETSVRADTSEESADDEESGETGDVVSDATQETDEDSTAQSAEESDSGEQDRQPGEPQVRDGEHEAVASARPDYAHTAIQIVSSDEDDDSTLDSDTAETAGEAGDVVLDSIQETGADKAARTAEERAIDSQASQETDPRTLPD
jgi:hypothetical protein